MTRLCPICDSLNRETLHSYQTTHAGVQHIFACVCGMVYASIPYVIDYAHNGIYEAQGALGSGVSKFDKQRLCQLADQALLLSRKSKNAAVLDVGCAQGGLLDAFKEKGVNNVVGMDPSIFCVLACQQKGHKAFCDDLLTLQDCNTIGDKYDLVIMSHVLEHIPDVKKAIRNVKKLLKPDGVLYIEVPDALRYNGSMMPFFDFNSEHINHFNPSILEKFLRDSGMDIITGNRKNITLNDGSVVSAYAVTAQRKVSTWHMMQFIRSSQQSLAEANEYLEKELADSKQCIIWGAGEYLAHVLALPVFKEVEIVQIVDRNPGLQGKKVRNVVVEAPEKIKPDIPIVIAALVARDSIQLQAQCMELKNKVIPL